MEMRLTPWITLTTGTFSAIVSPEEEMVRLLARRDELRRYLFLYISGNYSRLLSRVGDRTARFDVRRAFTTHQLLTILREAAHTIIFIEHDPTLFDGAPAHLITTVGRTMQEMAAGSIVLLYTPVPDRTFGTLAGYADRIVTLASEQKEEPKGGRGPRERPAGQVSLGAF